ncbi:MAG: IS3 family transposase [Chloroflexota bacterium]|nr:IS3 family transposase [Chloroflexota bacterium]
MEQSRETVAVRELCRVLDVSESGYYAWRETKTSAHEQRDDELSTQIQTVFQDSRQTYGSNRVEAALRTHGICTSRKRVARLMREQGLRSVRAKQRRPCLTRSVQNRYVVENLLAQNFSAQREHEKWVTDTTYIPTHEGWLYLVTVLDNFTRQIVGWSMGIHHDAQLAVAALTMALQHHRPPAGVILHSDRGSEFANQLYAEACEGKVIRSMSGSGNCYDNAMAESFFATLKLEAIHGQVFATRLEARMAIFDYIEVFYNRQRLHSGIAYAAPVTMAA